ncbi:GWxTD domain-containing protein [bacterium]|nr:GWxTD domain-containing protein [bacterium]
MGIDTLNVSYLIINKKNKTVFSDSLEIHGAHKIENKVPMNNLEPGEFDLVIQLNRKDFHYTKKDNFTIMWSPMFQIKDDFEVIIKQLGYIASETWLDKLESASDSLKFGLFQQFWKEKDPTPDTDRNEVKDEFYRRVAYANRHFSGFKEGWQTPRGKVYIIYGHPDEIESHPFDMDSKPYEIWYYFQINKKFIFVDKDGTNEYYLYYEE